MKSVFVIAGAQRSGTTYLYTMLDEHPDIYMAKPIKPEPKYFCSEDCLVKGREYYLNAYYNMDGYKAYGEKSTSYITVSGVSCNISILFPEMKIVFILRNPIERAVSNYWFSVKNQIEKESFLYAIKNQEERIINDPMLSYSVHPFAYLERGKYAKYIKRFFDYFPRERVYVIKWEDFIKDFAGEIKKIYNFLEVKDSFIPPSRNNRINASERKYNVLSSEAKKYLLNYYIKYNSELEKLLGIDCSDWNK